MMHREWILAEIQKLGDTNPAYAEILLIDATPPEPRQGTSQEGPPAKRTRSVAVEPVKVASSPKREGKQPIATERLRGVGQFQAGAYNLHDMKQVVELSDYLSKNGGWELFTTPKDGQCVFSSFLKGMDCPEEYRASHLRFQFGHFVVQNPEFAFNRLKLAIQAEYGQPRVSREEYLERIQSEDNPLTEDELSEYQKPGPFSFVSYLQYMMKDSSWGDEGTITLIGMMWQVAITVILVSSREAQEGKAHTFRQLKLRHGRKLEDVDFVLVYAGESHYLGACEYPFSFFSPSTVTAFVVGRQRSIVRRQRSKFGGSKCGPFSFVHTCTDYGGSI